MSLLKSVDDEELLAKIDNEGFDYFFTDYISLGDIQDQTLRRLVRTYRVAKEELEKYLEDVLPEEVD